MTDDQLLQTQAWFAQRIETAHAYAKRNRFAVTSEWMRGWDALRKHLGNYGPTSEDDQLTEVVGEALYAGPADDPDVDPARANVCLTTGQRLSVTMGDIGTVSGCKCYYATPELFVRMDDCPVHGSRHNSEGKPG